MKIKYKSLCAFHSVKDGVIFGVKRGGYYPTIKGTVKKKLSKIDKNKKQ